MRKSGIVVAVLLIAGAFWYFFHSKEGTSEKSAHKGNTIIPVSLATARTGDINVYLNGLGNIIPRNIATVRSRVDGQIMRIVFTEGQFVQEGDLLAELDSRPFDAQLEQAEGQVLRDNALLAEARLDLKRYQTLYAQDSIAKQQLDTQVSLVKQYEGAVKNDKGQIDAAKTQILYTRIISPFNGQVGLRQVDTGNIVHSADTAGIVVVTQLQPITAVFTLPEDAIPTLTKQMRNNNALSTEAWDRDNKQEIAVGTLLALDNQIDPTTGTVKLKAEFANKDNALFPSQFVNIRCKIDTLKSVTLIPAVAVQHGTQGSFVYIAKPDNTVTVQSVEISASEGDDVAIKTGIKPGDMVVTDGLDNLREGAKIEIASPNSKETDPKTDSPKEKKHKTKAE